MHSAGGLGHTRNMCVTFVQMKKVCEFIEAGEKIVRRHSGFIHPSGDFFFRFLGVIATTIQDQQINGYSCPLQSMCGPLER